MNEKIKIDLLHIKTWGTSQVTRAAGPSTKDEETRRPQAQGQAGAHSRPQIQLG